MREQAGRRNATSDNGEMSKKPGSAAAAAHGGVVVRGQLHGMVAVVPGERLPVLKA